ncbi:preprotein translocase subunit YajC [Candidatus Thioglobus sp.]|jgi:preprotein translocase subunit YajC|uniref:preprotein translocase subunit YajC n=1 Tax=Candidatus Thioglobus sp. TaxID=2026721 RepID=UPI001D442F89|nr:preprotein translocase subunit YajC [Candidatus Thioglobus sp.]MBT3277600.1 preprotein translocase subunit YajC [Candidatus Thioglobus sp.]MBT3446398.1 preprotein translocase subunit YajC [Candidatus Thioglobus sp.]MBT3744495.1 preprotein translocase subunit YajC [Candidatus Thioglobus sp.]MBT4000615.1 preprotein translocase subunit YajC [Candidatus Thioglobus sp.]MBT4182281.1 preprotein translocase subunit YajC [Candidatus Thioglobus sp.]
MNLLDLIITPAFAEEAATGAGDPLGGLPFLIIMFVLMYFLLIRPQQKRAKEHKVLLGTLKTGDEVVTNGGVVGTVASVDESFATLEIAKNVVVKVQKQGINQKLPKGSAKI